VSARRISMRERTGCRPKRRRVNGFVGLCGCCGVSGRCRVYLMRSSNSSFPPVQLRTPCSVLRENYEQPPQQANGSLGVYVVKGGVKARPLGRWKTRPDECVGDGINREGGVWSGGLRSGGADRGWPERRRTRRER